MVTRSFRYENILPVRAPTSLGRSKTAIFMREDEDMAFTCRTTQWKRCSESWRRWRDPCLRCKIPIFRGGETSVARVNA